MNLCIGDVNKHILSMLWRMNRHTKWQKYHYIVHCWVHQCFESADENLGGDSHAFCSHFPSFQDEKTPCIVFEGFIIASVY